MTEISTAPKQIRERPVDFLRGRFVDAARESFYPIVYEASIRGYENIQNGIDRLKEKEKITLPQAVDKVYRGMNVKTSVFPEDEETQQVLKYGAGVIVGNNQDPGANLLYLSALYTRILDNYSFFEKATAVHRWAKAARPHILPVFVEKDLSEVNFINESIKRSPDYPGMKKLTFEERRRENYAQLEEAARRVEEGGIVTLFPSGGGDEYSRWRRGIGVITQRFTRDDVDPYIIMTYLQGTSPGDKYRLAPVVRNIRPLAVKFYLVARKMSNLLEDLPNRQSADSKEIAGHLRDKYVLWVDNVKKTSLKK